MVRKLSSKCAIDTPMTGRAGALDPPHPGTTVKRSSAVATPTIRATNPAIRPPSAVHAVMTISICHDRRDDDTALDDVLNIGVQSDEREPARHNAENDGADYGTGDPPD